MSKATSVYPVSVLLPIFTFSSSIANYVYSGPLVVVVVLHSNAALDEGTGGAEPLLSLSSRSHSLLRALLTFPLALSHPVPQPVPAFTFLLLDIKHY